MSKILDMAVAIDEEFDKLRYEIETIHCHANQLEEQLACQKMKNCAWLVCFESQLIEWNERKFDFPLFF